MGRTLRALLRDLVVEQGAQLVLKEGRRKLERELYSARESSFPFISGDTFRAITDVVIEQGRILLRKQNFGRRIVFCDASSFTGDETAWDDHENLVLLKQSFDFFSEPPVVIIHNGDAVPQQALLSQIAEASHWVFASNLVHSSSKCTAVPVGLENRFRNRNGVLKDFLSEFEGEGSAQRPNLLFGSFNVETNREIRESLRDQLAASAYGYPVQRLSPVEYRRKVAYSKFVLSPPGNGPDCHRTWEAIYLGAIPVVLKGFIAPELVEDLPVIVVENYAQFLEGSELALHNLFEDAKRKPLRKAMMPHWVHVILGKANE